MTNREFLDLCDAVFTRYDFVRNRKSYYLDLGSDIYGAILFQTSDCGSAYYLNCGFCIKGENLHLPYPKIREVEMSQRIAVPGKEQLPYLPDPEHYTTELIKYEKYTTQELELHLTAALEEWVVPAVKNGYAFILAHEELYRTMLVIARALKKIRD